MATLSKRELILRIWGQVGGTQEHVHQIVQSFMDEIIDELGEGNRVELRNLAAFRPVRKPPRMARNPRTGERVQVQARTVVMFKPGRKMLKEAQQVKE